MKKSLIFEDKDGSRGLRNASTALLAALFCTACSPSPEVFRPTGNSLETQTPETQLRTRLCVVHDRQVMLVDAEIDASGDTLIAGRRYEEVHAASSPPYAQGLLQFDPRRRLEIHGSVYVANRPAQTIPLEVVGALRYYTAIEGVPIFYEPLGESRPAVVYIPVRPECVFQSFDGVTPHAMP